MRQELQEVCEEVGKAFLVKESQGSSGTGFPAVLGADFRAFVGGSPVQGGLIYKYLHQGVEVKSTSEHMATKVILNGSAI